MSRKHYIYLNDLMIAMFNSSNSKKELQNMEMLLKAIIRFCYMGNNFNVYTFRNRLENNLEARTKTLIKRFKIKIHG